MKIDEIDSPVVRHRHLSDIPKSISRQRRHLAIRRPFLDRCDISAHRPIRRTVPGMRKMEVVVILKETLPRGDNVKEVAIRTQSPHAMSPLVRPFSLIP